MKRFPNWTRLNSHKVHRTFKIVWSKPLRPATESTTSNAGGKFKMEEVFPRWVSVSCAHTRWWFSWLGKPKFFQHDVQGRNFSQKKKWTQKEKGNRKKKLHKFGTKARYNVVPLGAIFTDFYRTVREKLASLSLKLGHRCHEIDSHQSVVLDASAAVRADLKIAS